MFQEVLCRSERGMYSIEAYTELQEMHVEHSFLVVDSSSFLWPFLTVSVLTEMESGL